MGGGGGDEIVGGETAGVGGGEASPPAQVAQDEHRGFWHVQRLHHRAQVGGGGGGGGDAVSPPPPPVQVAQPWHSRWLQVHALHHERHMLPLFKSSQSWQDEHCGEEHCAHSKRAGKERGPVTQESSDLCRLWDMCRRASCTVPSLHHVSHPWAATSGAKSARSIIRVSGIQGVAERRRFKAAMTINGLFSLAQFDTQCAPYQSSRSILSDTERHYCDADTS